MRRLPAAVAASALLTLCACSSPYEPPSDGDITEHLIPLKDGRQIRCLVYADRSWEQGGLSCDWNGEARP